jgi:hypothetical protein
MMVMMTAIASTFPQQLAAGQVEQPEENQEVEVPLGSHSSLLIEPEDNELIILIQDDLADGLYNVTLTCTNPPLRHVYENPIEVLDGYSGTEMLLDLEEGIYDGCRFEVGSGLLVSEQFGPLPIPSFDEPQQGGEGLDGWHHISRTNELLDDAIGKYKVGDFEKAKELVIEAYIYHYNFIRPDIEDDNQELAARIGSAISNDLLTMIDNRNSTSELESKVGTIHADLETARTVVVPEFPSMALVGVATIAGIILVVLARICLQRDSFCHTLKTIQ